MSSVNCLSRGACSSLDGGKLVPEISESDFYKTLAHRGPRIVIVSGKANRKSLELPQRKVRDASSVFDAVRKSYSVEQCCDGEIASKAVPRKVQLSVKRDYAVKCNNSDSDDVQVVRRKKVAIRSARCWSTPSWAEEKTTVSYAGRLRATWYGGYEPLVHKKNIVVKEENNKVITVAALSTSVSGGGGRRRTEMRPRRRPALDLLLMRSNSSSSPEPPPLSARLSTSVSSLNILPRLSAAVIPLRRGIGSNSELAKSAAPLLERESSSVSLSSTSKLDGLKRKDFARSAAPLLEQDPSTESLLNSTDSPLRKCETVLALTDTQPQRPVNRLRLSSSNGSVERVCSRCSSLLSLAASGSRYSLSAAGAFVPVSVDQNGSALTGTRLCKLCLEDMPAKDTTTLSHCGCFFCTRCMQSYVEYEIMNGAYDISCPDSKCPQQGVMKIDEVERLTSPELTEKHKKFRINHEVSMDHSRAFCPRAGCETICIVSDGGASSGANNLTAPPKPVLCPTCSHHFCSACSNEWHSGMDCATFSRQQMLDASKSSSNPNGDGISLLPAESDLIKWCPMCRVPIEKDEGCAQMMCKRCKHVFCWYCLASLDDDFLLRHYDKGPCKNKLGHSRASVIWHRVQVVGIFAGFGLLLLVASPLLLLAAPCIVCCKCRLCNSNDGKTHDGDEIDGMDIEENNIEFEDNPVDAEIQSVINPISQ